MSQQACRSPHGVVAKLGGSIAYGSAPGDGPVRRIMVAFSAFTALWALRRFEGAAYTIERLLSALIAAAPMLEYVGPRHRSLVGL